MRHVCAVGHALYWVFKETINIPGYLVLNLSDGKPIL